MTYEFEGRTEREAIENAAAELGVETDSFDVEILENQAGGLFKKGRVKIRVHTREPAAAAAASSAAAGSGAGRSSASGAGRSSPSASASGTGSGNGAPDDDDMEMRMPRTLSAAPLEPVGEFENKMLDWVGEVLTRMGYSGSISVLFREERKLGLKIDSDHASIIIGKKGKNLDSLQLLANVYAGRIGHEDTRIILDSENYRIRREEALVRMAYDSAEQVRRSGRSVLLEPMNPFERRIVHTTLNDIVDIETKSEGEGLYKQVRVMFRGRK